MINKRDVFTLGGLDIVNEVIDIYDNKEEIKVLDVGCGCGYSVNCLSEKGFDAMGIDASEEIIDKYDLIDNEVEWIDDNDTYISSEILDVVYGKLSRYGPDCYGCSGYLAYGKYVGNGIINYSDSYYGDVRILAGDRSYPFGTIVRVSFNEESFLGIVLDRGGAIGFNKAALFDLLYPSEYLANIDGVNYNTKFEILRIGF